MGLARLVHAVGIAVDLQTAHAVVDHRRDDCTVERLGLHLPIS